MSLLRAFGYLHYDDVVEEWEEAAPPAVRQMPVGAILYSSLRRIVVAAWHANVLAKLEDGLFYEAKDILLRGAVLRAIEEAILPWGIGFDGWGSPVLYFDIPEHGQVSFHVFWEEEVIDLLPRYPYAWTGIRNDLFERAPLPRVHAMINLRDYLDGNSHGWSRGEIHNQLVRAGVDPAPVWSALEERA